ncbi:MAG: Holliday junction branch migration protein RuvA [Deltaproteobacteria bacterium]|nr:Holliday junction branch migration protein RuvA [Deltaproteobacteria bacterium]MBW1941808.1 Holliday junction branch migration protein RuvA [Deltaproteobacteria bacterium]MBW2208606.1 Holliday junction branch migration protein RuvA [Deltaproteobacteria bacterium]
MIAQMNGILSKSTTQYLIIDISGIGYEVIAPLSTFYALPEENENVSLHIYTHVREDALMLFGFHTILEKDLFIMLKSVSGIGPKLAINILSGMGTQELLDAIALGDAPRLRSIPGVGKKTAERIALELKDKAAGMREKLEIAPLPSLDDKDRMVVEDAVSALLNLGYPAKSAKNAVEKVAAMTEDISLETLIKKALKNLV